MGQGRLVEPSRQTVGEYLREWLPAIEPTVRLSTFTSYQATMESHVIPTVGSHLLRNLDAVHLNRLYADLLTTGRKDGKGGLSGRTVRYVHTVLHRALGDAVRWRRLVRNPSDDADPPRVSGREMKVWSQDQARAFLACVKDDRLYCVFLLALTTGMRRGELLGLRWSDLHLDRRRLSIQQQLVAIGYELHFSEPKTERSRRSVALDDASVAALRAHRLRQTRERLALGAEYVAGDLVFTNERGGPLHPMSLSDIFKRRARAAGIAVIRFHDLRHTHASLALAAGVHPKVVSDRLGHSTISITLDTYSHAIPALQEEAAAKVAGLLV